MRLPDLEGEAFIQFCPSESRYLYELVAGRLRAQGVAPEAVQTLRHTHSILALVDAGVGVALVPRSAQKLGCAGVRFRPSDEIDSLDVEVHLAWRRRSRQGVVDAVRLLIQEAYPVPAKA